jgi:hypothetical protein
VSGPQHGPDSAVGRYEATIHAWRERALAAEALVRAKDETIGELLDAIDGAHAAVREVNGQIAYWESEIKNASRAVAVAKAAAGVRTTEKIHHGKRSHRQDDPEGVVSDYTVLMTGAAVRGLLEENVRLENLLREKDETIGELLNDLDYWIRQYRRERGW